MLKATDLHFMFSKIRLRALLVFLPGLLFGLMSGCAGTPEQAAVGTQPETESVARRETGTRLEATDEYGFQVVEVVRVGSGVRTDYQRALVLLGSVTTGPDGADLARLEEGIAILEIITTEAPDLTTPHIDLGVAYGKLGDFEAAEQSFGTALSLAPNHPVAHNELGILYRRTGRFEAARASYEQALTLHPGYHFALKNLGVLCDLYLQDLACALQNYQRYAEILPEEKEVGIWIADIQNRLGVVAKD